MSIAIFARTSKHAEYASNKSYFTSQAAYALYLQHIGFVLKQMPVFKAKVVVPQREEREQD